ncbi:chaplin family protein [Catellatospora sp. KI3]|uniref:chaplin family protein n=1 Tax=Catellatospora sp. KI3 TaxID=3041620 RepID=UPI0024830377|nr:chaplin family protein [Catellatospora sp. KI3]MDI1465063.1 chaplin family protein [Catellatospora sp. KI3]
MNTWVRRSLKAGALTAGAVMATGTAAYAEASVISAGNHGILNGTQVFAPIQAPINLCGLAVGVAGDALAGCEGGSAAELEGVYDAHLISAGNHGILNGTQVFAPIQAPINVCGVAAGALGSALAFCDGGASAEQPGHRPTPGHRPMPLPRPRPDHGHGHNCGCGSHGHDGHNGHGGYGGRESARTEGLPLVGNLPLVGGLTNGGLPLVGELTGGGLPLVGSLGNLPVVGGLTSGGLGNGLPVVGPLLGGLTGGQQRTAATGADAIDLDALDAVGTVDRFDTESDDVDHSSGGNGGGTGTNPGGGGGGNGHHPTPRPRPRPQPCADHNHRHDHGRHARHDHDVNLISAGNHGILNGTQVYAPIQLPVDVSGVAVGVLGDAAAWSTGGASARQ